MSDCDLWEGAVDKDGYPSGRNHRKVLAEKLGRSIKPGYFACHTCDVPPCVNPDHLYEGTATDNNRDTVRRGRHKYVSNFKGMPGEKHPMCKLTDKQVIEIRERYAAGGISQCALADEYGVVQSRISLIVNNKSRECNAYSN